MVKPITIKDGKLRQTFNINFPDVCGNCGRKVHPNFLMGAFVDEDDQKLSMEAIFKCNNPNCNHFILGYYQRDSLDEAFKLVYVAPGKPLEKVFSKEIMGLSPKFIRLYNQLVSAEQSGLDLIIGLGYRKALETLVKDYLVYLEPQNKQSIYNLSLNQGINSLDNNNIKEISKRITGLDHYEESFTRQWKRKDIQDLKKLIDVTSSFFTLNLRLKSQLDQME
jgi:hypothetical protein